MTTPAFGDGILSERVILGRGKNVLILKIEEEGDGGEKKNNNIMINKNDDTFC